MKKIINHLIQLQDLCYAHSEQVMLKNKERLEVLEKALDQMESELPKDIADMFRKIQDAYELAVVPIVNNSCKGCGIILPLSFVHEVEDAKEIHRCPNCARVVYVYGDDLIKKNIGKGKDDKIRLGIMRFSSATLMKPNLKAKTKEGVMKEMSQLLVDNDFFDDRARLVELAMKRESVTSTALGNNLAFPHVRNIEGGGLTMAMGLKPEGVDFGSPDGSLAKIIFFLVIPTAASGFYLNLLSGLLSAFRDPRHRKAMLESTTDKQMWLKLSKYTQRIIR